MEYVARRRWIDDKSFADAVVFANSVSGATSSQVGIIVGTHQAGPRGLAAWLGFTTPSALLMIAFGYAVDSSSNSVTNAS